MSPPSRSHWLNLKRHKSLERDKSSWKSQKCLFILWVIYSCCCPTLVFIFFCVCVLCPIVDNFCLTGIEVNTTNEEGHKEWWTSTNREAIIHTQRNAMRLCQRFLPAWQRYGAKVVLVYMGFGSDVVALTNNIDFEGVLCAVVKITGYFTSFIIISSIYRLCLFNVLQSAKCVVHI